MLTNAQTTRIDRWYEYWRQRPMTQPTTDFFTAIPAWERDYDNYIDARSVVIGLALAGGDTDILGHVDFYLYTQQMACRPWGDVWAEPSREMPLGFTGGANADAVSRF